MGAKIGLSIGESYVPLVNNRVGTGWASMPTGVVGRVCARPVNRHPMLATSVNVRRRLLVWGGFLARWILGGTRVSSEGVSAIVQNRAEAPIGSEKTRIDGLTDFIR